MKEEKLHYRNNRRNPISDITLARLDCRRGKCADGSCGEFRYELLNLDFRSISN